MEYGQTSKELEEEYEEENEPPRHYRNSLLPHFRFGIRLPNSMKGMGGINISNNIKSFPLYDSTPWKTRIPKSGKKY
jgi:hypothetical protein